MDITVQQQLGRTLAAQRQQDRQTWLDNELNEDAATTKPPAWLIKQQTTQQQLAQRLTNHFQQLLQQLPVVANTNNLAAKQTFLRTITTELAKIYYLRLRMVELNDQLTPATKQARLQQLAQDCQQQAQTIINLLG
ncbi:MAG: hypothetical protein WCW27_06475 [Patescibacteria group bacterium]|jgi:hypothetical protein